MIALQSAPIGFREKYTVPVPSRSLHNHTILPEEERTRGSSILDPWKDAIARLTKGEMKSCHDRN